jgi:hypothetical protein
MNGLASLLRYQMGGPVGYVDGGQIDSIYQNLFNRKADDEGRAYYEALLKDKSVADAIAIIGGGATGVDAQEVTPQEIAGEVIKAAYSDTLSRSVDEIDPEGLTYYLGQVLYEGLDPTRIDDIFAYSPEAEKFEATLPGITDILKKNAAGGSYSVYTPPPVVTPPAVTGDTGAGAGAGAGVVTGDTVVGGVGNDTRAVTGPPVPDYGYINDLYKTYLGRDASPEELASYAGIFGPTIEPNEIKDFILGGVTSKEISPEQADDLLKTLPTPTPGSNQILGIPTFARQTPSDLTFAPLRRGLGQLRPAMSMTGLTSGQAAFGGVAPTPVQPSSNVVSPPPATPYALPEDFVLQTGAYGAPTPTFLALPEKAADPSPTDPSGSIQDSGVNPEPTSDREGGLIRMAEGGGPPKMTELSAKEAGSTFDISKYIDDQGRLVGGYSKPIYDENRVITGYEYRPYERDVVFNPRLREREAMGVSPEEQEMALRAMIARQGRTGVSPTMGGLSGIMPREAVMRRRPEYYNFAEGGLANAAQNLAARGRYGDSTLVHMAPEELSGLQALARAQGNDMTINPRTGLPEAFSLRKLFKAASFILPFVPIPGLFGMSSLLTKSILSGVAAGASAKGGFDIKQALGGGLKAYALGSLGEKMGGGPTPDGGPTAPTTTVGEAAGAVDAAAVTAPTVTVPGVDGDISLAGSYTGPGSTPLGPQSLNANLTAPLKVGSGYTDVAAAPIDTYTLRGGPQTGEAFYNKYPSDAVPVTGGSLPPSSDTVPGRMANVITPKGEGFGPAPLTKGTEIAMAGLGGFSLEKAAEETRRADIEAAAVKQKEEERERLFEELARRTLGRVAVKSGGQINLAKGGMSYMEGGGTTDVTGEPRMVQGTGDGMSDSVPATIEGVQEARLANDEFVIPADVVADIGNGSSNAGAKKLYNMMDRIRKARHGTTKQPPEIRAERLMPA